LLFGYKGLKEKPVEFFGMGSTLTSDYPPAMLKVQIGRVAMKARFVITKKLVTSPVLLGSDFLVKNKMSISLFSDGHWWVSIGPVDNPIGKIKCMLTHKITVMTNGDVTIPPSTCHKIRMKTNSDETFTNYETNILKPNDCLDKSILVLFEGGRDSITLSNFSPLPLHFPDNFPLGELEPLSAVHLTTENFDLINTYKEQLTDSLEEILKPGVDPFIVKEKDKILEVFNTKPDLVVAYKEPPQIGNFNRRARMNKRPLFELGSELSLYRQINILYVTKL
jgi:hypothetical protein